MKLINFFTMTYIGYAFIDRVNGKIVNYYLDSYGQVWLSESKYSTFKAPSTTNRIPLRYWRKICELLS